MKLFFLLIPAIFISPISENWGFFAHKQINRMAVFTLPPEMFGFYKYNIEFLTEEAITPDKRRYSIKEEAARHYIDLDEYDSLPPRDWKTAVEKFTEDTLKNYGILPWHIILLKRQLTDAFRHNDKKRILRLSADLGHYIADAHVPLHTTKNYNGQLTGQEGIHGFWESRLPELFFENYDLLSGKASYINDVESAIWSTILKSSQAVDSVLVFEKQLTKNFPEEQKYTYIARGASTVKSYSKEFSEKYHKMLSGQVERQFRNSIRLTGNIWYTCWVDAGKPLLEMNTFQELAPDEKQEPAIFSDDCHGKHAH